MPDGDGMLGPAHDHALVGVAGPRRPRPSLGGSDRCIHTHGARQGSHGRHRRVGRLPSRSEPRRGTVSQSGCLTPVRPHWSAGVAGGPAGSSRKRPGEGRVPPGGPRLRACRSPPLNFTKFVPTTDAGTGAAGLGNGALCAPIESCLYLWMAAASPLGNPPIGPQVSTPVGRHHSIHPRRRSQYRWLAKGVPRHAAPRPREPLHQPSAIAAT